MRKHSLLFTTESVTEIRKIAGWYEEQQNGLGRRFKSQLKKGFPT